MIARHRDIAGQKFGRWTVLGLAGRTKYRKALWKCRCECGRERLVATGSLTTGQSRSCGCLRVDTCATQNRASALHPRELHTWHGMFGRCERPSSNRFESYAGRGISICERWRDFDLFLADMGEASGPEYSIERIDNDGDYEPGNCRWATPIEQARNRRTTRWVTFRGETLSLAEWAERLGANYQLLWKRGKRDGWTSAVARAAAR